MADDFDWNSLTETKPEPTGEWDDLVPTPEEDRAQKLRETQARAKDIDPARQAKALTVAKDKGMPAEVAYENLDDLTKTEYDWDALAKDAPATADLMGDPQKGPVTKGDQDALGGLEKTVKSLGRAEYLERERPRSEPAQYPGGSLVESLFGTGTGVLTPEEQKVEHQKMVTEALEAKKMAKERERQALAAQEAERQFRLQNDPNYIYRDAAPAVTLTGLAAAGEVATSNENLTNAIRTPPTLERWRNTVDTTLSTVTGIPIDAIKGYGDLWDAVFYFMPQAQLFDVTDGDKNWIAEIGQSLKDGNKELFPGDEARAEDFWGTQVPAGLASVASFMGVGGLAKAMGMAPGMAGGLLGAFAGAGSGASDAERFKAPEAQRHLATIVNAAFGATEALPVDRFFKYLEAAGGRSFVQFITTAVKNAGVEMLQEGAQTAGPDTFARFSYDPNRDIMGNLGEALAVAGITGGGFGLLAGLGQMRTTENKQRLLDVRDLVSRSNTAKIAPEVMAEHLKKAAEAGDVPPTVTAPLAAVERLLQEIEPDQLEKVFPEAAEAIQEARTTGADVSIPVERLAGLSQFNGYTAFVDDVRVQPDDFTPNEQKAAQKEIDKFLEEYDTEAAPPPEQSPVFKNVYDQLVKAGQAPDAARVQARLYDAFFTTQAERSGKDPNELMRRYGFEVVSQESSAVPQGAMEQDTSTPEFRNWFGESQIVDEAGQPRMMYRGLTKEWGDNSDIQFWTDDPDIASGYADKPNAKANVVPAYLSIKNPYILKDDAAAYQLAEWMSESTYVPWTPFTPYWQLAEDSKLLKWALERNGYDGLIMEDSDGQNPHETVITLQLPQIKSPFNQGTFNPASADILTQDTASPAFKAWFGDSKVVDESGLPEVSTHYTAAQFDAFDHAAQDEARRSQTGYTTSFGRDFVFPRDGFFFFVGEAPPSPIAGAKPVKAYLSIKNPLDLTQRISGEDAGKIIDFIKSVATTKPTPGTYGYTPRGDALGGFRNARRDGITPEQLWAFIDQNSVYNRGKLWNDLLAAIGKDGLIFEGNSSGTATLEPIRGRGNSKTYKVAVALDPTQIKSVNNRGTFDPANPNILMQEVAPSGPAVDPLTQPGGEWRAAQVEVTVEGEAVMVQAGEAVDFLVKRRTSLRQLMECLDAS
jgi:hypothetical protein